MSDRTRHIRVYGYVGAPIVGSLNRGANLRFSILGRFNRIERRADATTCHQLDLTRARSQLFSGPQADLIGAVSNGCDAFDLGVAQRAAKGPRNLEGEPKISMSRGLRNHGSTRIDARPRRHPFVNRALQPEHRPTQITHCGETPHQRRLSLSRSQQMKVRKVGGHNKGLGCRRHKRMPMRVDKTRHQHASIPRNNADIGICIDGDRIQRDSLNLVVSNQHVGRARERGTFTVEDADILKERDVAGSQSSRIRCQTRCF